MEAVCKDQTARIEVGRKIRALREASGLSQNDLADLVGTNSNAVYRHENCIREMGIDSFFQYADALRVNPAELMPSRFYTLKAPARKWQELMEIIPELDDADIDALLFMATHLRTKNERNHK